jgi:4-amino-4-deoxy-L-arabinose transferase-like glycosyltransferase
MDPAELGIESDRRRSPADCTLGVHAAVALILFGASMYLIGLGSSHVLTYHEVVFAGPAKEMLETGNWVLPKLGGVPFTDKPPATAWSIAACMLFANSRSEWVIRLPAVFAAVTAAIIVAGLTARWFGRTCGFVAGMIQLTCVYVFTQARLGESDMLLTAATSAAMGGWALAHVESPRGRWVSPRAAWLFYAMLLTVFFIKGLVGPVLILAGCLSFAVLQRDARQIRFLFNPVGLLIFLVPIVCWFTAAYRQHPDILDNMILHHFGRFSGKLGRHEPWFGYWYLIPLVTLPWFPFAVLALARGWKLGWSDDVRWRFLVCWFVPGIAILSCSTFKARHYPMPLLPPIAILAAQGLLDYMSRRSKTANTRNLLLSLATVVGCGAAIVLVLQSRVRGLHEIAALIALLGVGLLVLIECERRRRIAAGLTTLFATAWLLGTGVQLFVFPQHDTYLPQTELADRINRIVPAGETVYMVGLPENQITYYLDRPVVRIDDPAKFRPADVGPHRDLFVIAPQFVAHEVAASVHADVVDRCTYLNSYLTEQQRLTFIHRRPHDVARAAEETSLIR